MNRDPVGDLRLQRASDLRKQYYTDLAKFAVRMGCSRSNAHQVVHDTLIDLAMLEPTHTALIENERAWLYGVVRNKVKRLFKDRQRCVPVSEFLPASLVDQGLSPEKYVELRELLDAIRKLPERHRLPLALVLGELPYSDIAEILDCSIDNAKQRVCRARKELRKRLGTYPSGRKSIATLGRAE